MSTRCFSFVVLLFMAQLPLSGQESNDDLIREHQYRIDQMRQESNEQIRKMMESSEAQFGAMQNESLEGPKSSYSSSSANGFRIGARTIRGILIVLVAIAVGLSAGIWRLLRGSRAAGPPDPIKL